MKVVSRLFAAAVLSLTIIMPARAQSAPKPAISLKTVVIDAGHGGKDAGCISRDKKTYEKNITLDVAKRLAAKISAAYPEVKVLLTRDDDTFVELENRAAFANKASADLFISIHVNAVEKGTTASGYSIHCLGQSHKKGTDLYSKNLDLVKRENSVILLEDGYEARYQGFDPNDPQSFIIFNLMQNSHLESSLTFADDVAKAMGGKPIRNSRGVSQDPFWVLWRTAMPSVLIEIGFMTNPEDLEVIRSESGRDGIAQNICNAFRTFKTRYDGSVSVEKATVDNAPTKEQPKTEKAPELTDSSKKLMYGIQVLVSSKEMDLNDPFFEGYTPVKIKSGRFNKYIIGSSQSQAEVKKTFEKVQKLFPDSFIIKYSE